MMPVIVMAAAALAQAFDCQVDAPRVISLDAGTSNTQLIDGLSAGALSFRIQFKGNDAEVIWKDSPIQMQGKQVVLPTSISSGLIFYLSGGPCLFTETACGTLVNYAKQPDGTIKLILTPTAITTDKDKQVRTPFLVAIPGQCKPAKDVK